MLIANSARACFRRPRHSLMPMMFELVIAALSLISTARLARGGCYHAPQMRRAGRRCRAEAGLAAESMLRTPDGAGRRRRCRAYGPVSMHASDEIGGDDGRETMSDAYKHCASRYDCQQSATLYRPCRRRSALPRRLIRLQDCRRLLITFGEWAAAITTKPMALSFLMPH